MVDISIVNETSPEANWNRRTDRQADRQTDKPMRLQKIKHSHYPIFAFFRYSSRSHNCQFIDIKLTFFVNYIHKMTFLGILKTDNICQN